jgi:hypothetical protein
MSVNKNVTVPDGNDDPSSPAPERATLTAACYEPVTPRRPLRARGTAPCDTSQVPKSPAVEWSFASIQFSSVGAMVDDDGGGVEALEVHVDQGNLRRREALADKQRRAVKNVVMTSSASAGSLGLGVDAGLTSSVARELAVRCADLGYGSLWSNDEPGASGLEMLAHFAVGAPQLDLGVGVLPIDQHPPAHIATEIDRLQLDPAKLWIGLGSGRLRPQLAAMRDAVAELRELLPAARIMIGAMRPQLCRLGGLLADGVLLNWMMPAHAVQARGWVHEGAVEAGRAAPITALYIRVAVGGGAAQRLRDEEGRYRQ